MAIWQYSFFIIPFWGLELNESENIITEGCFADDLFWINSAYDIKIFDEVCEFLPKNESSWSLNLVIYGSLESHCIEVLHEHSIVKSVSLRIDFSISHVEIINKVVNFLSYKSFLAIDQDLCVLPNCENFFLNSISKSRKFIY